MIGRSGTGKTTLLIKKINEKIKQNKNMKIFVFAPTAHLQKVYEPIQRKITGQSRGVNEKVINKMYEWTVANQNTPKIIIFDDLGEDHWIKYKKKDNKLNEMIVGSRHYKIDFYFLFQRYKQALPVLRQNSDFVILFEILNQRDKKEIHDELAGDLDNETWNKLLNFVWKKKYDYLEIDRTDTHMSRYFHNEKELQIKRPFFDDQF